MVSYFDNLILDLTYLIISYLDKPADLNKLIDSSIVLKARFYEDDAWKIMFYHNIKNPLVDTSILYRDNYYTNMDKFTKYKLRYPDEWEYLVIYREYMQPVHFDDFINNYHSDFFGYNDKFELKFVTKFNKIEYINNFDTNVITTMLSEILIESGIYIGLKRVNVDELDEDDIINFFSDVFSINHFITETFQINNMIFGYKEWTD